MKNVVKVNGYIRAVADQNHPLQTRLSLILTDFAPNGNKQGIPLTEKQNIINSALYTPIKINFNGESFSGHTGAIPIGPIVAAYEGQEKGRDVIFGDAILWNDIYGDISDYLKAAFVDGVGTSWEIYYEDATIDNNDVEWLNGCVFAGTCVVETPAYGPNRTRILAIAEKLNGVEQEMSVKDTKDSKAEDLSDTRIEINETTDLLYKLWEGLDQLYTKTFEIEQATVETDIGKIAASFAERIAKIADHISKLTSDLGLSTAELDTVKQERDQLKQEKETAELASLTARRRSRLAEIGIEIEEGEDEKLKRYVSMSEDVFTALVADFSTARKPVVAEKKESIIPEPTSGRTSYSNEEIAAELKKELSTKRR